MARKPRLHVPGGLYHVILRGNARQDVFFTAGDRKYCYELLAEGVSRFGYRVHAFCLMSNHMHLALQAGEAALSVGIQNLSFRYTRYLNARLGRVGHVFQGRFKAYLVDQDRYGLALIRYIHLNPVRARLVKTAGAYAWSSHRVYLQEEDLPWVTTDWVLGQFANSARAAVRRYARFLDDASAAEHSEMFYGGKADSRVVGEEDFVRTLIKKPARIKPPRFEAIEAYVCNKYALTREALLAQTRSRLPADGRALLAWLAIKSNAGTLTTIAAYFGRDISTVSHALSRLEARSRNSPGFASTLEKDYYAISQA